MNKNNSRLLWKIKGMHCASCAQLVKQELSSLPGVENVMVSLSAEQAVLNLDKGAAYPSISAAGEKLAPYGFSISEFECGDDNGSLSDKEKKAPEGKSVQDISIFSWIKSFIASGIVIVFFIFLQNSGIVSFPGILSGSGDTGSLLLAVIMGFAASVSSCLAVVGSIVISFSILSQNAEGEKSFKAVLKPNILFQAGRIAGFTILGGMLGLAGGSLSVKGPALGFFEIILAVMLMTSALAILGAGKYLERAGFKMPSFLSNAIGMLKSSKNPSAPLLLGAMTFFLPCGFTQSMQLTALGSSSFLTGSLIMLAFSLGTLPVLFAAGLTAGWSRRSGAVVIQRASGILIGFFAIMTFLAAIPLFGYSGNIFGGNSANSGGNMTAENFLPAEGVQKIEMHVTFQGFEPSILEVRKGVPVEWTIWGDQITGCTNAIIIPSANARFSLKKGENKISFTPQQAGTISYSCWMGMVRGEIRVVD